jgi:ribosomal protein S12 methylthiotransferase accessory factor YcaO
MQPQQPQYGNAGMEIDHEDEQANQPPPVPLTAQQLLERLIAKAKAAGMPVFCEDTSLGSREKYVIIGEAFIEFTSKKA